MRCRLASRLACLALALSCAAAMPLAPAPAAEPARVDTQLQEKFSRIAALHITPPDALDFPPREARFLRVVIHVTSGDAQPCIDELEVFGPGGKDNLALSQQGAVASASSLLPGYAIHQIPHLNDGQYGNSFSWIAASSDREWAQIQWPAPQTVSRVIVTRDRKGEYRDRIPEVFEILLSLDGQEWQSVAKRERSPADQSRRLPYFPVDRLPEQNWQGLLYYAYLRERVTWKNLPGDDHLSPLITDRPASPGGPPYWGRLARLAPLERVLVLFEELIDRLQAQGLDVSQERHQASDLRRQAAASPDSDSDSLYIAARHAKRLLFFRDPALAPLENILFNKRHPFLESHNYSEHLDGILESGGGVYSLRIPRDQEGRFQPELSRIEELFDASAGIVREPVSDFEAKTIYFAYRPEKPDVEGWSSYWHIYAMNADGSAPRALTGGPFHDFDAVCLPDGGLAFHSTRCAVRFLCWRPQAYVLYRMDPDGSNIRRLSFANLSEWKPSVMQSGRILWTRSEYLDKGADFGHSLWSIRPDGTHPELVFGNDTPNCYSQAHEVPGSPELVCTLMSHGDHSGPIALIDRSQGLLPTEAITSITPDTPPQYQMSRSHQDTFRDPYPISRDHFLVAHNPDNQHNWALYVIDRYGNRELLYLDPEISSYQPTPLMPRTRPPVPSTVLDAELAQQGLGQFIIQDVYQGLAPAVRRGQVKFLQVSEEVPSNLERLSGGEYCADHPPFTDFYAAPVHLVHGPPSSYETRTPNAPLAFLKTGLDWPNLVTEVNPGLYRVREPGGWPSFVAKASLGTVPISDDGSASFVAPAGKVLYFHLLDADYNELQRMRSVAQLQPGERRGCIGCHEHRGLAPSPASSFASARLPLRLDPPPWGTAPFDYQLVVQPVLDAHCVRCHDGSQSNPLDLRGTLDPGRVPASYRALIEGGFVHYFDFTYGMRHFKAEPMSFGTLRSRLWTVLADEHHHQQAAIDQKSMRAIKTWIDLNCPLWPDYIYRPDRPVSPTAQLK